MLHNEVLKFRFQKRKVLLSCSALSKTSFLGAAAAAASEKLDQRRMGSPKKTLLTNQGCHTAALTNQI
jgi:hypothetical protein